MQQSQFTVSQQAPQPSSSVQAQQRFQIVRPLGTGGQGFVQLVYDTSSGRQCAVKYIDRGWSRSFYKYVSREILNHASLSLRKHPHIVEFQEVFLTPRYLGVVMEYVNGTNLQQYLEASGGRLGEDVARFIFQQLMIAVDFCHKNGKVNRDIKLANVLLQLNGNQLPLVKLCDFGFSKDKFDDSEPQTQIGTALFTAPEIFTNTQGQIYDAEAADVWSCGVVLYVMLCGGHPFLSLEDCKMKKHTQVMKLIENSVNGRLVWPEGFSPSPQAVDLIKHVLVSKPAHRYKLSNILQHPWFLEKLPPGALSLNSAYLSMTTSPAQARQTPEAIKQIVRAAVSINSTDAMMSSALSQPLGDTAGAGGTESGALNQGQSMASTSCTSTAPTAAYASATSQPAHQQATMGQPSYQAEQAWGSQAIAASPPLPPPHSPAATASQGAAAAAAAAYGRDSGHLQGSQLAGMGGAEGLGALLGQPGAGVQPFLTADPSMLIDLNVGANVLLDSSLLMDMNLGSLEH